MSGLILLLPPGYTPSCIYSRFNFSWWITGMHDTFKALITPAHWTLLSEMFAFGCCLSSFSHHVVGSPRHMVMPCGRQLRSSGQQFHLSSQCFINLTTKSLTSSRYVAGLVIISKNYAPPPAKNSAYTENRDNVKNNWYSHVLRNTTAIRTEFLLGQHQSSYGII